ncbi:MAG: heparin lyase I family protein [Betaproteobacteria bacterium]
MRSKFLAAFLLTLVLVVSAADRNVREIAVPSIEFSCLFESSPKDCGFAEQSKVAGRASLVDVAGMRGVRLHTEPGDSSIYGSRAAERNDLTLDQATTDCYEGKEAWWAHSILFPADYVDPPESTASSWNWGVVADFHNARPGGGQANFQVNAMPASAASPDRPTGLSFQIAYGNQVRPTLYNAPIGPVVKNVWYHFIYHVKWTSQADGFFDAWVNGARKMAYRGPTLYPDQGCYLKLANYHSAFGKPSSVIHARVIRGVTPRAVSAGRLQGILP